MIVHQGSSSWRAAVKRAACPSHLTRHFTSCARLSGVNPLLNLSVFSGSKEAQYFSKERKIPRIEFSPYLELIRSSEVDPFAPAPGTSPTVIAALKRAKEGQSDIQAAYSLAVANLVRQLEVSRRDAQETTAAFNSLYDKYKKQERQALLAMLTAATLLSLALVRPNFIEEVWQDVQESVMQWTGVQRVKPLLNKETTDTVNSKLPSLVETTKRPDANQGPHLNSTHIKTVKSRFLTDESTEQSLKPAVSTKKALNLSKLFWAD